MCWLITRLDRLARSTRDLLNVLDEIKERGAGFRSLANSWADTTTPHGKLMLTVLGGLAEFERTLIAARTGEGRRRAKDRGVRFGRPHKMTPHQRQEAVPAPYWPARPRPMWPEPLRRRHGHDLPTGGRKPFRARRGRPVRK